VIDFLQKTYISARSGMGAGFVRSSTRKLSPYLWIGKGTSDLESPFKFRGEVSSARKIQSLDSDRDPQK
jgi:hypothetical protein